MPGLFREQSYEFPLRAAVALAKGMNGVDLTEVVGGTLAEGGRIEATQEPLRLQPRKSLAQRGSDVHGSGEGCAAYLGQTDLPKFAGPWKYILKQIPMNLAEVRQIKIAWQARKK